MRVLYVKFNNGRNKRFQVATVIYEEKNKKYVKKIALCKDAISHLMKMKENYIKFTNYIINPKLKLAKIINEEHDSLVFEYIEGVSLSSKYISAQENSPEDTDEIIQEYQVLLERSFKTTLFDSNTMVTQKFKEFFGELDYSKLDGKICFDGVSNIDLIFSNLIIKDNLIYIIDYEWIFDLNLPIDYIIYRALLYANSPYRRQKYVKYFPEIYCYMERNLIEGVVLRDCFCSHRPIYLKNRVTLDQEKLYESNKVIGVKNKLKELLKVIIP